MDTGLLTRTEKSVLFVIPWGPHWLIGDTDTEWPYDPAHPTASRSDLEYLLAKVNAVLRDPLVPGDIEGVFAGLRPLVAAEGADTTRLSRSHTVSSPQPGLSVIAGGKFTTYRVMARDVIDAAVADLAADGSAGQWTAASQGGSRGRAVTHPPDPPARGGRVRRAACLGGPAGGPQRAAGRAGRAAAQPVRIVRRRPAGPASPAGRTSARNCPAGPATWPPRSPTPARTRARSGWTTHWPGAPGSRSRPGTVAWPPPRPRLR